MTTYPPPLCLFCKRLTRTPDIPGESYTCEAYPEEIPATILHSDVDHRERVKGDHGLRFVPQTEADEDYAQSLFDV